MTEFASRPLHSPSLRRLRPAALLLLGLPSLVNACIIAALSVLSFSNVVFVHPMRVVRGRARQLLGTVLAQYSARPAEGIAERLAERTGKPVRAANDAGVQGLGVILVPDEFVSNDLSDGTLVRLLPDWQPDPHALFAVYPFHKEQSRNVRLFIEFLVKAFQLR